MDFIKHIYIGILLGTSFINGYYSKENFAMPTKYTNNTEYIIKPTIERQYYSPDHKRKEDKKSKNTILKEYAVLPRRLEDILDSIKIASQDKKD